jgi:hypothetical protein
LSKGITTDNEEADLRPKPMNFQKDTIMATLTHLFQPWIAKEHDQLLISASQYAIYVWLQASLNYLFHFAHQ